MKVMKRKKLIDIDHIIVSECVLEPSYPQSGHHNQNHPNLRPARFLVPQNT